MFCSFQGRGLCIFSVKFTQASHHTPVTVIDFRGQWLGSLANYSLFSGRSAKHILMTTRETPVQCLIEVVRMGILSFSWFYGDNVQYIIIKYGVSYTFSIDLFISLRMWSSIPSLLWIWKKKSWIGIDFCWMTFPHPWNDQFLSFYSVNMVISLFDFFMLNWLCDSAINPTWSWSIIFCYILLGLIC